MRLRPRRPPGLVALRHLLAQSVVPIQQGAALRLAEAARDGGAALGRDALEEVVEEHITFRLSTRLVTLCVVLVLTLYLHMVWLGETEQ